MSQNLSGSRCKYTIRQHYQQGHNKLETQLFSNSIFNSISKVLVTFFCTLFHKASSSNRALFPSDAIKWTCHDAAIKHWWPRAQICLRFLDNHHHIKVQQPTILMSNVFPCVIEPDILRVQEPFGNMKYEWIFSISFLPATAGQERELVVLVVVWLKMYGYQPNQPDLSFKAI